MNLFEGEQILTTTNENIIVLTTLRIRYNSSEGWGSNRITSIMLEKISSIEATSITYPILLVLAALSVIVGVIMGGQYRANSEAFVPFVIGGIFVIIYLASRRRVCVIASDGGARIIVPSTMKKEAVLNFIDNVERAKFLRVEQLRKNESLLL